MGGEGVVSTMPSGVCVGRVGGGAGMCGERVGEIMVIFGENEGNGVNIFYDSRVFTRV